MAEIKSFKYGENLKIYQDSGKMELENPIADIGVEVIPTNITFSAACYISDFDYRKDNVFLYNLKYKGAEQLKKEEIEIAKWQPETPEVKCAGVEIWIDFRNIFLGREGVLETEVYFNDELLGVFPINVLRKKV